MTKKRNSKISMVFNVKQKQKSEYFTPTTKPYPFFIVQNNDKQFKESFYVKGNVPTFKIPLRLVSTGQNRTIFMTYRIV